MRFSNRMHDDVKQKVPQNGIKSLSETSKHRFLSISR